MCGCRWLLLAPLLSDPLSEFGDMQFGWLDEFQSWQDSLLSLPVMLCLIKWDFLRQPVFCRFAVCGSLEKPWWLETKPWLFICCNPPCAGQFSSETMADVSCHLNSIFIFEKPRRPGDEGVGHCVPPQYTGFCQHNNHTCHTWSWCNHTWSWCIHTLAHWHLAHFGTSTLGTYRTTTLGTLGATIDYGHNHTLAHLGRPHFGFREMWRKFL